MINPSLSFRFDIMPSFQPLRKKQCREELTSIDDLPPNILQIILNCMPLLDAVRTSVLSKQWRYKYKSLYRFIFDKSFYGLVRRQRLTHRDVLDDYINIAKSLLLSQIDPTAVIDQLHIYIPVLLPKYHKYDVEHWIRAAATSGVRDLTLEHGSSFEVPQCLFSCLKLTHLRLCNHAIFNLPLSFRGFPHLISLRLGLSAKLEMDKLESLISACPELRHLELCLFFYDRRFYNLGLASPEYLRIYAPKLEHFDLCGGVDEGIRVRFICGATTNMKTVSLRLLPTYHNPGMESLDRVEFFGAMHNVENLTLDFRFWKVVSTGQGCIPHKFPSLFPRLKILKLSQSSRKDVCDQNQLLLALCLIRSSPNIRELDIFVKSSTSDPCLDHVLEFPKDCRLGHLKTVSLRYVTCSSMDFKVIKFLLSCSPALEVMYMKLYSKLNACQVANFTMKVAQSRPFPPMVDMVFDTNK